MSNDGLSDELEVIQGPEITETEVEEWFESEDIPPDTPSEHVDIVQRYSDAQLRIVRSTMDLSLHNLQAISARFDLY